MTKKTCKDTLVFKNLPSELNDAQKQELLQHYGARYIKIITSKYKNKSKAFARFESEDVARSVMCRLHQLIILGSRLSVEYAEDEIGCEKLQDIKNIEENKKNFNLFLNKLNSWNTAVSFNQPPPPNLKYVYPRPNCATINNIAHALASVPKFYTQVLHLMNRMNLPPPFSSIPDPPMIQVLQPQPQMVTPQQQSITTQPQLHKPPESSSESEYESDPEDIKKVDNNIIPQKRTKPQKNAIKKPKFIKPTIATPNSSTKTVKNTDEIFEKVDLQQGKKIELKLSDSIEPKQQVSEEPIEGFGIISSTKTVPKDMEMDVDEEKEEKISQVINEEELTANRISAKDLGVFPVFKNYHQGAPTCRLYIKNLAKNVELSDLEYIYKRYEIPQNEEEQGNMFDIRLMQEGRMKGQAFVTLQNVALAQKALKETNGFILKSKPLVVVFARSAVPKPKSDK